MCSGILAFYAALLVSSEPAPLTPTADTRRAEEAARNVVQFCKDHVGKKVGNGECGELAKAALLVARARRYPPHDLGGDFLWGKEVLTIKPGEAIPKGVIHAGDILQFRDARFPQGSNSHHTAIVVGMRDGGRLLSVLHQNAGPSSDPQVRRKVQPGEYTLSKLQGGWIKVYRPEPLPVPDLRKFASLDPDAVEVVKMLNANRAKAGQEPLKQSIALTAAAAAMAHKVATGEKQPERSLSTSVQDAGYAASAEAGVLVQGSAPPAAVVPAWTGSVRELVLSPRYTEMGVFFLRSPPERANIYAIFAPPAHSGPQAKKGSP